MQQENKQCYMCRKLDRYYTKGSVRFNKTKYGWCAARKCNVGIHDTCEEFVKRQKPLKIKRFIQNSLDSLLCEISSIRSIIEAEKENENGEV